MGWRGCTSLRFAALVVLVTVGAAGVSRRIAAGTDGRPEPAARLAHAGPIGLMQRVDARPEVDALRPALWTTDPDDIHWCEGDVILLRGRSWRGMAVRALSRSGAYTHVGLVARVGELWTVVEAAAEAVPEADRSLAPPSAWTSAGTMHARGVRQVPLDVFVKGAGVTGFAVYRLAGEEDVKHPDVGRAAAGAAQDFANAGIGFDGALDFDERSRLSCTELVVAAYEKAGIVLPIRAEQVIHMGGFKWRVIAPDAFAMCPAFEFVANASRLGDSQ